MKRSHVLMGPRKHPAKNAFKVDDIGRDTGQGGKIDCGAILESFFLINGNRIGTLGSISRGYSVIEEAKALKGEEKSFRIIGKKLRISD